jgi:hypothetical protein
MVETQSQGADWLYCESSVAESDDEPHLVAPWAGRAGVKGYRKTDKGGTVRAARDDVVGLGLMQNGARRLQCTNASTVCVLYRLAGKPFTAPSPKRRRGG